MGLCALPAPQEPRGSCLLSTAWILFVTQILCKAK